MESRSKIANVLKSAFLLYKRHFLILISLSISQVLIKYIRFLSSQSYNRPALLEILFLVFEIWISIGFIAVISNLYKNKSFDFQGIFTWVRKKFWSYFGIIFVVGLIGLLAAIPNLIVLFVADNFILKLALTILFAPLPIYFYTIFNFAPIITVLKGYDDSVVESDSSLEASSRLVKQNFWIVLILLSISYLVDIPDIIRMINAYRLKDINALKNIMSFRFILQSILIVPLIHTINIILYYLLNNKENHSLIRD